MLLTMAAFSTTMYGTVSCRLLVISFATTGDSFEDHFAPTTTTNADVRTLRNALGMFRWLRPIISSVENETYDWTSGACVGYQQTMLEALADDHENLFFTVARILAIIAILLTCGLLVLWAWSTACLALTNRVQGILVLCLAFLGVVCTAGSVGSMLGSSLCTSGTKVFARPPQCEIDQGGLVMLGASLLWLATAIFAGGYIWPTLSAFGGEDTIGEILPRPHLQHKPDEAPREIHIITDAHPESSMQATPSERFRARRKQSSRKESVTVDATEANATEVYISNRLNRIEELANL